MNAIVDGAVENVNELLNMDLPSSSMWSLMPTAASSQAQSVDGVFYFWFWTCFGLVLTIVVPMTWFVYKYRRKHEGQKALTQKDHNQTLEILWSVLPFFYLMVLFVWGFYGYLDLYVAPLDSKELRVVGQKWMWTVQYPEEEIEVSGQGAVIGVALNQPVRLRMSSQDVIHSFFIPNFRVKQDVIPGRYTTLWFEPTEVGEFPVFCTEFCGDQHSDMLAKIKVMPQDEYNAWVQEKKEADKGLSPLELGKKLYTSKGCLACHSVDGKPGIAPTFKGLYGTTEELSDGKKVKVDDNYIRQSILNPQAQITKGYPPVMPTFKGQVSEKDIIGLIEFIKSLK